MQAECGFGGGGLNRALDTALCCAKEHFVGVECDVGPVAGGARGNEGGERGGERVAVDE